ncbi:MAG: hypothetical protein AB7E76_14135 [Deferribacterales bacterium]
MNTESLAVNYLKTRLGYISCIKTFIPENDKEPIWDGYIIVYSLDTEYNSVDDYQGCIDVQVKGKSVDKHTSDDEISYNVKISHLKAFLSKAGTIFFVVHIDKETKGHVIFYSALLPFDIKLLLSKTKKSQKNKSIKLIKLPNEESEIIEIFNNFLEHKKKQMAYTDPNIIHNFGKLTEDGKLEAIQTFFATNRNPIEYIKNNPIYLYKDIADGYTVPIAKAKITLESLTKNEPIYLDGIKRFNSFNVTQKDHYTTITFGENITMSIGDNGSRAEISWTSSRSLKEAIKTLEFIVDFSTAKVVGFGKEKEYELNTENTTSGKEFIDNIKLQLKQLHQFQEAIHLAGSNYDLLNPGNLQENEFKNAKSLVQTLVLKEPINTTLKLAPVIKIKINNLTLMLLTTKNTDGDYMLYNFFDSKVHVVIDDAQGDKFQTTQFIIMKKDDFIEVSNIDYSYIDRDIKDIKHSQAFFESTNQMVLEMLLAYDETMGENNQLLDAALSISKYLYDNNINGNIYLLNYFQCLKRLKRLSIKEKAILYNIYNSEGVANDISAGICILLDEFEEANKYLSKLDHDAKELFMSFPIYNLLKNNSTMLS